MRIHSESSFENLVNIKPLHENLRRVAVCQTVVCTINISYCLLSVRAHVKVFLRVDAQDLCKPELHCECWKVLMLRREKTACRLSMFHPRWERRPRNPLMQQLNHAMAQRTSGETSDNDFLLHTPIAQTSVTQLFDGRLFEGWLAEACYPRFDRKGRQILKTDVGRCIERICIERTRIFVQLAMKTTR